MFELEIEGQLRMMLYIGMTARMLLYIATTLQNDMIYNVMLCIKTLTIGKLYTFANRI